MTNADKRSTVTDALETLGTRIAAGAGRDAIHLAVEPVMAAERLLPGQHVGFVEGGVGASAATKLGIVDPFIIGPVNPGEHFWMVVYPRTITSLRHVWTHPAFGDVASPVPEIASDTAKSDAEQWLRNYANEIDETFTTLMDAADEWVNGEQYFYGARTGDYYGKFEGESTHPDFWDHYEDYTGKTVPDDRKRSFFTCSC